MLRHTLGLFIAVGLPLVLAAIYGPNQQTSLSQMHYAGDVTTVVPVVVPIPNSATPSLGNVTVIVGPGITLRIITRLRVYNGLVSLTRAFDFSHFPTSPDTESDTTDARVAALHAKPNAHIDIAIDVVPIAIPIPGLGSTIIGNATVTVDPKGGLRVAGGLGIGNSTAAYTKGLSLQPYSSPKARSDLKKRSDFLFFADQCKVDSDCAPEGQQIPCKCSGIVGFRTCQCISIAAENGVKFDRFQGILSDGNATLTIV